MALDNAVMVLDSATGIEPQTKKLFAVCHKRKIPIMTFINKALQELEWMNSGCFRAQAACM